MQNLLEKNRVLSHPDNESDIFTIYNLPPLPEVNTEEMSEGLIKALQTNRRVDMLKYSLSHLPMFTEELNQYVATIIWKLQMDEPSDSRSVRINQLSFYLAQGNWRLIFACISDLPNSHLLRQEDIQDSFQVGFLEFKNAAERYDPRKGKFITYAYKCISGQITSSINEFNYPQMRRHSKDDINKYWKFSTKSADVYKDCYEQIDFLIHRLSSRYYHRISPPLPGLSKAEHVTTLILLSVQSRKKRNKSEFPSTEEISEYIHTLLDKNDVHTRVRFLQRAQRYKWLLLSSQEVLSIDEPSTYTFQHPSGAFMQGTTTVGERLVLIDDSESEHDRAHIRNSLLQMITTNNQLTFNEKTVLQTYISGPDGVTWTEVAKLLNLKKNYVLKCYVNALGKLNGSYFKKQLLDSI